MKKVLIAFLLSLCLITLVIGCSVAPPPEAPKKEGEEEGNEELDESLIQNFTNAWEAYIFASNHFENVATDYVSYLSGTTTTSTGSQGLNSERYKSSATNNFYFAQHVYGEPILGVDPSMASKYYKTNNSSAYQFAIVQDRYHATNNPSGVTNKYKADFTNVNFTTYANAQELEANLGIVPTRLTIQIVDATTVTNKDKDNGFKKLPDGGYEFYFDLNSGAHKNYKTQVKAASNQDYGNWISTKIAYTLDKYGRVKKIELNDKYTISVIGIGITVTSNVIDNIYYGTIPTINFNGGNPIIGKAPVNTDRSIKFMLGNKLLETRAVSEGHKIRTFPEISVTRDQDMLGWFTQPKGQGIQYTEDTIFLGNSDLTLYADVRANRYTLTLYDQNGELLAITGFESSTEFKVRQLIKYAYGSLPVAADLGITADYTFFGWFTEPDGKGILCDANFALDEYKDVNLYAHVSTNKYSVIFHDQDGEELSRKVFTAGLSGTDATNFNAAYFPDLGLGADYSVEWYTEPNGQGKNYWKPSSPATNRVDSTTPYADIKLYPFVNYNKHTATFNFSDGTLYNSQNVTTGLAIGTLPTIANLATINTEFTPTADWTLIGWFTEPNGQGVQYTSTTVLAYSDITLYAHVLYNKYSVIFYNTDGTEHSRKTFTAGLSGTSATNFNTAYFPTAASLGLEDYNILGWYTEAEGQGRVYWTPSSPTTNRVDTTNPYADIKLYPVVRYNKYTAAFNFSDGTLFKTQDIKGGLAVSAGIGTLPTIANLAAVNTEFTPTADWTLIGWFTEPNGQGVQYTSTTVLPYDNITLYAHVLYNKYSVIFYNLDGTEHSRKQFTAGLTGTSRTNFNTAYFPTAASLGLEEYNILGWYTEVEGQGTEYWTPSSPSTNRIGDSTPYEDIKLYVYAIYNKFEVTFNFSDGTLFKTQDIKGGLAVSSGIGTLPTLANLAAVNEAFTPTADYTLIGWFTAPNGQGVQYTSTTVLPYNSITLYAHVLCNKYSITFFSSLGVVADSRTYTVGQTITQTGGLPALTLSSDYNLVGWFTGLNGGGVRYLNTTALSAYENVTLYAYVRYNQYTITVYNANGSVLGNKKYTVGQALSAAYNLPSASDLGLSDDYDLLWFTQSGGKGVRLNASDLLSEYADVKLYAYYMYNKYYVTFYDDDNRMVKETIFKVGDLVSAHSPAATKDGYTFQGWFTEPDGGGTQYKDTDRFSIYKELILYAYFTENTCVAEGTLITLADGTQVPVEQLTGEEWLLVWNMLTGQFDIAPILFIASDPFAQYEIIHLYFSDGTDVKVITEHGFWNFDLNSYVFLRRDAAKYIGHWFNKQIIDSNGEFAWIKVQLVDVQVYKDYTTAWSPVTYGHLCLYVNGILSMPSDTQGFVNIFAVDQEAMQYNQEALLADIEQYGLFTYEDFAGIIPEEIFEALQVQYLKISMAKGLISWEIIYKLISTYESFWQ